MRTIYNHSFIRRAARSAWFLGLAAALLTPNRMQAQLRVINVDFNRALSVSYSTPSPTYEGQGAYADPGHDYWNRFEIGGIMGNPPSLPAITNSTSAPLKRSDGTNQTEITVSLNDFRAYWAGGGRPQGAIRSGPL